VRCLKLDIRHFGKKVQIMAKKTARQILDRIEELHNEEQSLLDDLKDILFEAEDDDDLDADFDEEELH
tara:strand:- start:215 stop:418 length:204 start_codon:yes stop_codon:yes gene_type:complete